MDPLSITALVTGLVSLSAETIKRLHFRSLKGGVEDTQILLRLIVLISNISGLLGTLQTLGDQSKWDSTWLRSFDMLQQLLRQYHQSLQLIEGKLTNPRGKRKSVILSGLIFSFTKAELIRIKIELESIQTSLSIVLQSTQQKISEDTQKQTDQSLHEITDLLRLLEAKSIGARESLGYWGGPNTAAPPHDKNEPLLKWLSPLIFSARQSDIYKRREESTGHWFLEDVSFRSWLCGDTKFLWCPGVPGSGKTIIASIVVDHLENTFPDGKVGIAYIYCNYRDQLEQTANNLIGSLLRQLLELASAIPKNILDLYHRNISRHTHLKAGELIELLLVEARSFERVFIVVDALDECQEGNGTRANLLAALRRLKPFVSLLVTSRFTVNIPVELGSHKRLEIVANQMDIQIYVLYQLRRLHAISRIIESDPDFRDLIVQSILKASSGMFLLAQLHVNSLSTTRTKRSVKTALLGMTNSLSEVYSKIVDNIWNQERAGFAVARETLAWICHAERPLSIQELQYALSIEPREEAFDPENVIDVEDIVEICGSLIVVDQSSSIIRLVHYTAQDFFESRGSELFPNAHAEIALKCLTCISYKEFAQGPCSSDEDLSSRVDTNPLLEYATQNWAKHIQSPVAPSLIDLTMHFLSDRNLLSAAVQLMHSPKIRYPDYSQRYPQNVHGLHLSALFGLLEICNRLLKQVDHLDLENDFYGTPLQTAAWAGQEDVVSFLLENGASVNAQSGRYDTALQAAAHEGHLYTIDLLFGHRDKANPNLMGGLYDTALQAAAWKGHGEIVTRLVERGAQVDAQRKGGRNALLCAAAQGHADIVSLLLDQGAFVDTRDGNYGRTSLSWAAWNGHEEVVKILICHQANINAVDHQNSTPLHLALERHQEHVVKLLVDKGARLDVVNDFKKTQAQLALDSIEKIDTANFEHDVEMSDELEKGTQALSVSVYRRKLNPSAQEEKYKYVIKKAFSLTEHSMAERVEETKRNLVREHEVLKNLNHPNIVKYLKYEEVRKNGKPFRAYLYTEYCDGGDLMRFSRGLPTPDCLSMFRAWSIMADLAAALAYCHHGLSKAEDGSFYLKHDWQTILHRDIKPANVVMLMSQSGVPTAKLCDLGLAKFWNGPAGYQSKHVGTERYWPNEIEDGEPWTMKGDVYALGATLRDLCLNASDPEFDKLVSRCTDKVPKNRPSSLTVLQEATRHLAKMGYQTETSAFLIKSPEQGSFLLQTISEALDRFISSYQLMTRKRTREMVDRIKHLIEDGEGGGMIVLKELGIWNLPEATLVLGYHDRTKDLVRQGQTQDPGHLWRKRGITALHLACGEGLKDIAQVCLEHNADVNAPADNGWTPLHWAAFTGHRDICRMLLNMKAAVDPSTDEGATPLHKAAEMGHIDVLQLLLAENANCNAKDKEDVTPLHRAAASNQAKAAFILLEAGANSSATDKEGFIPEQSAKANGYQTLSTSLAPRLRNGTQDTSLAV